MNYFVYKVTKAPAPEVAELCLSEGQCYTKAADGGFSEGQTIILQTILSLL